MKIIGKIRPKHTHSVLYFFFQIFELSGCQELDAAFPSVGQSLLLLLIFGNEKRICLFCHVSVLLWHIIQGHVGNFLFTAGRAERRCLCFVKFLEFCLCIVHSTVYVQGISKGYVLFWERIFLKLLWCPAPCFVLLHFLPKYTCCWCS